MSRVVLDLGTRRAPPRPGATAESAAREVGLEDARMLRRLRTRTAR
ncbi:hypothetical protein [Streptomyces sp. NBC_00670]|nr:hypothetical protein [Streptomyces sp. NBC_00670]